jgi:1-acyl-sn-glycerol-3-phosphate acyltransferase
MSGHLRAIVRLFLIAANTAVHLLVLVLGLPFVISSRRRLVGWRIRCARSWSRLIALSIRFDIRAQGRVPEPPFFLVTNHLGYTDIILLEALVSGFFVAKSEIARWPVMGKILQVANTIFIEQGRKTDIPRVLARVEQALEEGTGVILFPEAEAGSGERLLPFRSPLLEVAVRGKLPVSYAAISYETHDGQPPAAEAVHWYGDMRLPGHLYRLLQLRRFSGTIRFGDGTIIGEDRKLLATRLYDEIDRLLKGS